jgi:uncharacterized membrane protein YecN with MAPEG domain
MRIVPIYAALLALLFVVLSVRTLRLRGRLRVALGDGGRPELQRAMRVHANFAEYAPLGLLLIAMLELQGAPGWQLHALGVLLLFGRAVHAVGVSRAREKLAFRVTGMAATLAVLIAASIALLLRTQA